MKTSWEFQAGIHNNSCTHSNWYFLPWHRAYLLHFEAICRDAANDPEFVLPYWDWTTNPRLPALFTDKTSVLYDDTRELKPNQAISDELVGRKIVDEITSSRDFIAFAGRGTTPDKPRAKPGPGQLEFTPHNGVHSTIRGHMVTFMSPLDPIFWLHHANVDRLWAHAAVRSVNKPDFLNGKFKFYKPDGSDSEVRVAELISHRGLGYRYDDESERVLFGSAPYGKTREVTEASVFVGRLPGPVRSGQPQTATAPAPQAFRTAFESVGRADAESDPTPIRLTVEGVATPADQDVAVRVFLNTSQATADTSIDGPGYVGTFTFFDHAPGAGHDHAAEDRGFTFDATNAARRLQQNGLYTPGQPFTVTLVTVPLRQPAANVVGAKMVEVKAAGFKLESLD